MLNIIENRNKYNNMNEQEFFSSNYQNVEKGNYTIFESASQEAVFNWFNREDIKRSHKDNFIKALIDFKDNCGGFYQYRGYFLAAKFINTFKDSNFGDEIVAKLLYWSYDYFRQNESSLCIDEKLTKEARKALNYTDKTKVIANFINLIETTKNESVLRDATQKLIELNPSNELAISTHKKLLQNTKDKIGIFESIRLLYKNLELSKSISQQLKDILVKLLEDIKSGDNSEEAWISNTFYYVNRTSVGDKQAINALIKLIERLSLKYPCKDEYLCQEALKTLGIIGKKDPNAIKALNNFIHSNHTDSLLCLASRALWFVEPGNLLAINTCVRLLENAKNPYIIHDAALFLLKDELKEFISTEAFTTKAINSLIDYIRNTQWIDICGKSISILEKISASNEVALQGLFQLLDTVEDKWVRIGIANSILRIDYENEKALNAIYQALKTTEDDWKLYNIAKNLLDIDPNNKIAWDTFEKLLTTSKEKYSRLEIAKKLVKLDSDHQTAIDTLCELIYMPRLHDCIAEEDLALPVLEQIDPTKKLAVKAIEEFCQKTKNQDGLIYAIKHLQRLDPENDIAQKRLERIITAVINSMQTYDPEDNLSLLNVGLYWRGIMKSTLLPEIVTALKPYLNKETLGTGTNYNMAFSMMWDCANNMSYLDFYRAWHTS